MTQKAKDSSKMKDAIEAIGGPTIVIFIGAFISAIGAVWATIDQNKTSKKLEDKNEEIARLSKEIAESVTGGSSFCSIVPMITSDTGSPTHCFLRNHGKFPLYDVTARIVDLDIMDSKPPKGIPMSELFKDDVTLSLGSIPPNSGRMLPLRLALTGESRRWNIFFSARNGFFTQVIRYRKIDGTWRSAKQIVRDENGAMTKLLEEVDAAYPRKENGEVDWN